MTYNYEALLDEHFQMMCQALLLREFPSLQCLPVGMPDGGRDAIDRAGHIGRLKVFQVKFARDPSRITDPVFWAARAISKELPKIARLIEEGAASYVLITNVKGTSHPGSGRIDRMQQFLESKLSIPAQCWWRDDLDRRLDSNFDLRLRYPALLDGQDLPRLLLFATTEGERVQAQNAILAYLKDQNYRDSKIRFKQIDLPEKHVFDLFVDVPVKVASGRFRHRQSQNHTGLQAFANVVMRDIRASPHYLQQELPLFDLPEANVSYHLDADGDLLVVDPERHRLFQAEIGGAQLLLEGQFGRDSNCILIEGAPGQGKSTLTQYLAEVHRVRILQTPEADRLPSTHVQSRVRVPIRVELRDLAEWLMGTNPWEETPGVRHDQPTTLEGAIAEHIRRYSGGFPFDVAKLHMLATEVPVLLLLDGLDEVADLGIRRRVIEQVQAGIQRLAGNAADFMTIVTSRPTALPGSPTLSSERFFPLTLQSIRPNVALEYANRWAAVRDLDSKYYAELAKVLQDKLNVPHMAELAKNTMQLSILLTLIHITGSSLPDKRTELYDTYVGVFLNRESEKNEFVRSNRKLLINVHCYLAFYLHATAEQSATSGRIYANELRRVVGRFLKSEGLGLDILDTLLLGAFERIVAIVSRVEGTYEFEVQPLREYFAAKYLYLTASYSPTGKHRSGTKPDRFDAIAPNPYWHNVTRFYAGCFSKGELRDLAERVGVLVQADGYRYGVYARTLATSLLQDNVFDQSIRATDELVETVFDDFGLRLAGLAVNGTLRSDGVMPTQFSLTSDAGGSKLGRDVWRLLCKERRTTDRSHALAGLAREHIGSEELSARWIAEWRRLGSRKLDWLRIGSTLEIGPNLTAKDVSEILERANGSDEETDFIVALAEADVRQEAFEAVGIERLRAVVLGSRALFLSDNTGPYGALSRLTHPARWMGVLANGYDIFGGFRNAIGTQARANDPIANDIAEIPKLIGPTARVDLGIWNRLVELVESDIGPSFRSVELAVIAAGIRNQNERGAGAASLFDIGFPAPHRVRSARRRARNLGWWSREAELVTNDHEALLWMLSLCAWAAPSVVVELSHRLDYMLRSVAPTTRSYFVAASLPSSDRYLVFGKRNWSAPSDWSPLPRFHPTTIVVLRRWFGGFLGGGELLSSLLRDLREPGVAITCLQFAVEEYQSRRMTCADLLRVGQQCQQSGRLGFGDIAPIEWASDSDVQTILENSATVPDELIRCALMGATRSPVEESVMSIALRDNWSQTEAD